MFCIDARHQRQKLEQMETNHSNREILGIRETNRLMMRFLSSTASMIYMTGRSLNVYKCEDLKIQIMKCLLFVCVF